MSGEGPSDSVRYQVSAGGVIYRENQPDDIEIVLIAHRKGEPWRLPKGRVEQGETLAEAALREVHEETGLRVGVEGLIDVYFFADDPRGNGILIVYKCRSVGGELTATAEAANPTFFAASDIPQNLAGGGHDQAIHAWQSSRRA